MFGFGKSARRKKFYENSFYQFYQISDDAGVPRDRAIELLELSLSASNALEIMESLSDKKMKPIDAAIVLSDLIVRDTLEKQKFFESTEFDQAQNSEVSEELGFDISGFAAAFAKEDVILAEKIQKNAFFVGNQLGASIAPTQGAFGEEISNIMGEFIKPMR